MGIAIIIHSMATPGALANLDDNLILERIANGAITQRLAHELGVHHSNLYRRLAQNPEYHAARQCGMEARLDSAEMAILDSDERTLPRAREHWRCVTWRAEREHRAIWGQQGQTVQINAGAAQDGVPSGIQVVFVSSDAAQQTKRIIDVTAGNGGK